MVTSRVSSLWRHPEFLKFWAGQTVSQAGSQISALAIPLTAVLLLNARPAEMGLLGAAQFAPALLFGLVIGAWVDRAPRRPVLIAADIGRALLLAAIPVAVGAGVLRVEYLIVIAFLVGTLTVLFDVAYQSFLPSLIERDQLVEGNSKLELGSSAAQVAGPSLAGLIIQAISAPFAVVLDALSFLASAAFVLRIRVSEPPPAPTGASRTIWRDIAEGVHAVGANPYLRAMLVSGGIVNLCGSLVTAVYILYVTRELGLSAAALGLVLSAVGVGTLVGPVAARPINDRIGVGPALVCALVFVVLARLCAPLAGLSPGAAVPVLILGQALAGGAFVLLNVSSVSLRQAITLRHMQGRVSATARVVMAGGRPIGALLGGVLAEAIGLQSTLVVGALGTALGLVALFASPIPLLREPSAAAPAEATA